jgi:branched-chain amino acid transport system substrate-binding protein
MIRRRTLLKGTAAVAVGTSLGSFPAPAISQNAKIKLGYVSPQTGPLAAFAESDKFNIDAFLATDIGKNFDIIVKDSQSNSNRAAEVAKELIVSDKINLMLVASTPENTNPVATTCEAEEIPCISTKAPWQPWFIGQQGNPGDPASWKPFNFAYHYFWGLEDIIAVFTNMWAQLETNKKVGGLFPNDGDGNAWGDPQNGLKPGLAAAGFELNDPGRYQNLSDDFTAQINAFKAAGSDIITGVVIPPDFTTFWNQAKQQGMKPKAVTVAKAILFPQSVEALGENGHNLSSEVWWSSSHPFKSSVTGQSSADLAAEFTAKTGRPWTQPIGFIHSLFEMASNVMGRVEDVTDAEAVAAAIAASKVDTVVGHIEWNGAGLPPFAAKNVAKTPLVGGQWRRQPDGKFELVIVDNKTANFIPAGGTMEALA